jgi:hypothetical protein
MRYRVDMDRDGGDDVGAHDDVYTKAPNSSSDPISTLVVSCPSSMNTMKYSAIPVMLNIDTGSAFEGIRTDPSCRTSPRLRYTEHSFHGRYNAAFPYRPDLQDR